jgi:hypothetical protein
MREIPSGANVFEELSVNSVLYRNRQVIHYMDTVQVVTKDFQDTVQPITKGFLDTMQVII